MGLPHTGAQGGTFWLKRKSVNVNLAMYMCSGDRERNLPMFPGKRGTRKGVIELLKFVASKLKTFEVLIEAFNRFNRKMVMTVSIIIERQAVEVTFC